VLERLIGFLLAGLMPKNSFLWRCMFGLLLSTCLAAQSKPIGAQVSTETTAVELPDDVEREPRKLGAGDGTSVVMSAKRIQPAPQMTPAPQPTSTWIDPTTGLMWTKQDNGSDVDWNQAKDYCRNLRLGGYSGWSTPSIDELAGIYGETQNDNGWHIKGGIQLSSRWGWSSNRNRSFPVLYREAWNFSFDNGKRYSSLRGGSVFMRTLCVRHSGE